MIPSKIISTARRQTGCTTDIVTATEGYDFLNTIQEDYRWDICNEAVGDKMNTFNINLVAGTNTYTLPASAANTTLLTSTFGINQSVKVGVKLKSTDTFYTTVQVKYVEGYLNLPDFYAVNTPTSVPTAYLVGSDSIVIFPTPQETIASGLEIMGPKAIVPVSASTEDIEGMIIIPPSVHQVLVEGLKYLFWGNMGVNFEDRRIQAKQYYESEKLRTINQLMNKNILGDESFIPDLDYLG